jgi:hypothetical protein
MRRKRTPANDAPRNSAAAPFFRPRQRADFQYHRSWPSLQSAARRANRQMVQLFDLLGMTSPTTPIEQSNLPAPKNDLFQGFRADPPLEPPAQKYFSFFFSEIDVISLTSRLDQEGRFAIVTSVGRGMRWAYRVAAWLIHADEQHDAYGEIVWSWRPGAGALRNVRSALSQNGGKTAGPRGDHV